MNTHELNRVRPRSITFLTLPGPTRKRLPSPYCYRLTYETRTPMLPGCLMVWDVMGGRDIYQVVLERNEQGCLCWHCTCPDAVYRGESRASHCKHVHGLQSVGRQST